MHTKRHGFERRPLVAAIQAALLGLALLPAGAVLAQSSEDEPTVAELTKPTNSVEVGVGQVSRDSEKAHEYDGLQRHGTYGIGNFDLRGGADYDSKDPTRWRIAGTNLGLETRDIELEYGRQGSWRVNLGFDELLRSGSAVYESIKTPYQGVGSTSLTLPSNWSAPLYPSSATMATGNAYPAPSATMLALGATSYASPLVAGTNYICRTTTNGCAANAALGGAYTTGLPVTAANTAMLAQNLTDAGDFQSVRLSTRRDKQKYAVSYELNSAWNVAFGMQREDKRGLKPLGVVNSSNGGYAGENSVTIPEVIDTTTDQYNVSLNFKGEKTFFTAAYYAAMFANHAKSMTVTNPYATGTYNGTTQNAYGVSSATISEEPDTVYNQLRMSGGYQFTPTTRLVADGSFAINTQNDAFILDPALFSTPSGAASPAANNGSVVPRNSANAEVVTRTFDLKLSGKPLAKLSLDGAYKFDERDNKTPVDNYVWYDAGAKNFGAANGVLANAAIPGVPGGTPIYSGVNVVANRPYSRKLNELDLDADYALARGQALRAGLQYQSIDRWCNGTWIDCSFADASKEATLKLEYRFRLSEDLSGRFGADEGKRHVDYNPNAWMALAPALGATNIATLAAQGYSGSVLGFLNSNGLSPYGLSKTANTASGFTGSTLAVYNLLFGSGNGGLTNTYYGINNVTQNWPGLDVYNMANRDRTRLRGSVDWQATEALAFQAGADYRRDTYPDDVYGLQSARNWTLNLDGDYRASENLTVSAYYAHEDQRNESAGNSSSNGSFNVNAAAGVAYTTATGATGTNSGVAGGCIASSSTAGLTGTPTAYQIYNNNLKLSPCNGWQSVIEDRADTIGLAFKKKRLILAKLTTSGDVSYTRTITGNGMSGGSYTTNTLGPYVAGAAAVVYMNAAPLPDVVVSSVRLRLAGDYQINKASMVRVGYSFTRLQSNDYTYASTSAALTSSSVMPVMAQAPAYSVSVVGVSYSLRVQ